MSDGHVHVLSSGLSDADGMHTCTIYLHCRIRILRGAGNPLMKGNLYVPYNSTVVRIGKRKCNCGHSMLKLCVVV